MINTWTEAFSELEIDPNDPDTWPVDYMEEEIVNRLDNWPDVERSLNAEYHPEDREATVRYIDDDGFPENRTININW